MWKAAAACAALWCIIGTCSADCTTVEGHECCTFTADDSHAQNCGRIGSVLPGDDKQACGQHCLENDACFWTYSAGGDYAGDCELLGRCGENGASNRPFDASYIAEGTMHSAGCFSWGDSEPVRPQLSLCRWPAARAHVTRSPAAPLPRPQRLDTYATRARSRLASTSSHLCVRRGLAVL
jgi:hypothetical protein